MEKCAEQQRLLFLGMCSLEDRKRICDEKIMDLYNFERITYLLEAFGFEEYKFVFEMKYKDLLLKLADIVEQNLVNITVRQSRQSGVARATCPD